MALQGADTAALKESERANTADATCRIGVYSKAASMRCSVVRETERTAVASRRQWREGWGNGGSWRWDEMRA